MSMNLTCRAGGQEVTLWQTPTWVTWMCLSYHPRTHKPDGGHEGVRRRYLIWVEGHLNGIFLSEEDAAFNRWRVNEHLEKIRDLKRPQFSYT